MSSGAGWVLGLKASSNPPTRSNGQLTGGFGFLNYTGIAGNSVNSSLPTPRTGQIVARIQF